MTKLALFTLLLGAASPSFAADKECSRENLLSIIKASRELHLSNLNKNLKASKLFKAAEKEGKTLSQALSEYYLMLNQENAKSEKSLEALIDIAKKYPECDFDKVSDKELKK